MTIRTYTITAWKEPPVYAQTDIEASSAQEALDKANAMMTEIDDLPYERCAFDDDGPVVEMRAQAIDDDNDEALVNLDPVIDELRALKTAVVTYLEASDIGVDGREERRQLAGLVYNEEKSS